MSGDLRKSEFAEYCKVSAPAITKAIVAGRVRTTPNGKFVDMNHPITMEYVRIKLSDGPAPKQKRKKRKPASKPPAKRIAQSKKPPPSGLDDSEDVYGEGTKTAVDVKRVIAATTKINLEIAEKAGRFLLKERVAVFFAKISTAVTQKLTPLGARLASDIGDICGVSDPAKILEIQLLIEAETQRAIEDFKRVAKEAGAGTA